MKRKNKHNANKVGMRTRMRAKLTFDEGFAENPLYRITAVTTEKNKGLYMIDLIQKNFNISQSDVMTNFKKEVEEIRKLMFKEQEPVKWTRDERGEIKSPFAQKIKDKTDFSN